jgi:hypothetical protein
MRKLASVQRILDIRDVAGTDLLQVARVLGWSVIINKNDGMKVGDLCVYFEIDSKVPEKPEFEFLRKRDFKIKTMKMRGEISQGLVMPLSILSGLKVDEGDDVTKLLSVEQFNAPKPVVIGAGGKIVTKRVYRFGWIPSPIMHWLWDNCYWLYKVLTVNAGDSFPPFVPKTDETRVQVMQPLLDKWKGEKFVITEKIDGQSITVYMNKGDYGVCSRNVDLDMNNRTLEHVGVSKQLGMENILRSISGSWALQGELAGPGIQGNKLELTEKHIFFFNAFNIDKQRYVDHTEFVRMMDYLDLETVPVLDVNFTMTNDIDTLVKLSTGKSALNPKVLREGLVFRPPVDTLDFGLEGLVRGRVSFKAVSPEWLLSFKE